MTSAIVVGSGPNGLAAAVRLARAGVDVTVLEASDTIGGGTRSGEMIVPGLLHDHCSAVHPIAAASPFFDEIDLTSRGVRWLQPAVDCVHPLDDGSAGVMYRSIDRTAEALGDEVVRIVDQTVDAETSLRFTRLLMEGAQEIATAAVGPSRPSMVAMSLRWGRAGSSLTARRRVRVSAIRSAAGISPSGSSMRAGTNWLVARPALSLVRTLTGIAIRILSQSGPSWR